MFPGAAQLAKVATTKKTRISHQQRSGTSFIGVALFYSIGGLIFELVGCDRKNREMRSTSQLKV